MFIPDLKKEPVSVLPDEDIDFEIASNSELCFVGWLDKSVPFSSGRVTDALIRKLGLACLKSVMVTRGYHQCPFCASADIDVPILKVLIENQTAYLGHAEIWIPQDRHLIFRAPNLIYHYVVAHNYLPPSEFRHALDSYIEEP